MNEPGIAALLAASEATWPAARIIELPGWRIRDGAGGGQRVSAASATTGRPAIAAMEAAQAALGQVPLVMIRPGEEALDTALAARGYEIRDPVMFYAGRVEDLATIPPPLSVFEVPWPPMRVQEEIWEQGGVGRARLAVMDRAGGPKCTILGRVRDHPAGTAFVAAGGEIAMLHALEVAPHLRRAGTAANIMRGAALWARSQGVGWLAVAVTEANRAARALYSSLCMRPCGGYHYRGKVPAPGESGG